MCKLEWTHLNLFLGFFSVHSPSKNTISSETKLIKNTPNFTNLTGLDRFYRVLDAKAWLARKSECYSWQGPEWLEDPYEFVKSNQVDVGFQTKTQFGVFLKNIKNSWCSDLGKKRVVI